MIKDYSKTIFLAVAIIFTLYLLIVTFDRMPFLGIIFLLCIFMLIFMNNRKVTHNRDAIRKLI